MTQCVSYLLESESGIPMLKMTNKTIGHEQKETEVSLLGRKFINKSKCNIKRRILGIVGIIACLIVIILSLSVIIAVLYYAEFAKSTRCSLSDSLSIDRIECAPPAILESLIAERPTFNGNDSLTRSGSNYSCHSHDHGANSTCMNITNMAAQKMAYIQSAEEALAIAWEILHDEEGWILETGSNLKDGRVYSKNYKGIGKVAKLQAIYDASPELLFEMLVTHGEDLSSWHPGVAVSETIEKVTDNVEIHYMVTRQLAGGILSSRDYLNVVTWKTRNNVTYQASVATTHPSKPPTKARVRAEQKPGGAIFRPVDGKPNKCLLEWTLSVDAKGWVPQWAVDKTLAPTLNKFHAACKEHIKEYKKNQD